MQSYVRTVLPEVSRTFAINIPVLPEPLDLVVTVAYLLCRIADTIEDEARGDRSPLFRELAELVALPPDVGPRADQFAARVGATLRPEAPPSEVKLVRDTRIVLEALAELPPATRPHVERCVSTMARGMDEATREPRLEGIRDLEALMSYCYYVAGTVGEMLTALFVDHSPVARAHRATLEPRARAFGRALQLTNILKDIREDLDRGICWLPVDRMAAHGLTAQTLAHPERRRDAVALLDELIGVARVEVERAFEYSLALPEGEPGMRLFCLWPLLFAVKTLALLAGNPAVFEPAPIKLSRETIASVMVATKDRIGSNDALRDLYRSLAG